MVVDHHLPKFEGTFHANPRLAGIDGDRELSGAGMAYLVAQMMGDNRDLSGLVIPGIIGDGQEMTGKNLEIFNDGIAEGIIVPDRGLTLPGRDMTERWYTATSPYLDGISGGEQIIADLMEQARDLAKGENAEPARYPDLAGGTGSSTQHDTDRHRYDLWRYLPSPAGGD